MVAAVVDVKTEKIRDYVWSYEHDQSVTRVMWSPSGRHLLSSSLDRTVRVTPVPGKGSFQDHLFHAGAVGRLAGTPKGLFLAAAVWNKEIAVWKLPDRPGMPTVLWYRLKLPVTPLCLAFAPDGWRLAIGGDDGFVLVINVEDHQEVLKGHYGGPSGYTWVTNMAWSPEGEDLAIGGAKSGRVELWNTWTGQIYATYHDHGQWITGLAWSPDGTQMASASFDGMVRVWTLLGRKTQYIYPGHHYHQVNQLSWSPCGQFLASASSDRTVHIWKPGGGRRFLYQGHDRIVSTVDWSPDGQYLASGGYDQSVQVWRAPAF